MTQCEEIVEYMKRNGSISDAEAFVHLRCRRLASRIYDIRADGKYDIGDEWFEARTASGRKTRYKVYFIKGELKE